jgi:hypothetical protein
VRKEKLKTLVGMFGRVEWRGNLGEMREDRPRRKSPARRKTKRARK